MCQRASLSSVVCSEWHGYEVHVKNDGNRCHNIEDAAPFLCILVWVPVAAKKKKKKKKPGAKADRGNKSLFVLTVPMK